MSRNPMLALGFAAGLALGVTAAQAQTSTAPNTMSPNSTSQPSTTSPSSSTPSGGAMNSGGNAGTMAKATKAQKKFLDEAIEGDMAEVKVGQLAQQNGDSQDVKQLGQTLQQDHGQHLQKAQQMAQQMGVTAPTEPNAKQRKTYDRLSKEHGARFDKAFARAMVADHKEDIAKYEHEAKGKGPLAQFAQQTVPTLQKHLRMAEQIENKGAATGSGHMSK